jgi:hypothetical protein
VLRGPGGLLIAQTIDQARVSEENILTILLAPVTAQNVLRIHHNTV